MRARQSSIDQKRLESDYEARYTGDLPKFLGSLVQAILLWFAARFPFLSDKAAASNKRNPSVDNADNFMVQASGIIAGLFGYLIGKALIKSTWVGPESNQSEDSKEEDKPFNPSYRIYKTVSVIFQAIGSIFLVPVFFVGKVSQRLEMGFSAALIGSLGAIVTPFVLWVKKPFLQWLTKFYKDKNKEELKNLFKVAQDGWSKYMRTALYWGMCIGGIFGPLFLGHGSFNNLNTAVTYSGAIGGLCCCALSLIFVPLLNYISKRVRNEFLFSFDSEKLKELSKSKRKELKLKNRNKYHDNYFRAGMSICLAGGAAVASVWGLVHGFPVDDLLGYAAWGGAMGGAIGGVGLAFLGEKITDWVNKPETRNPWDFILNNTGTLFSYAGTAIGVVAGLVFFPGDSLSAMALGTCLGKAGGTLVGVAVGCRWNSAPEEYEPEDGSYWTQRMLLDANRWGIIGAALGAGAGVVIYLFTGLNLFTVLGASVTIGTSTFSFIAGAIGSKNKAPKLQPEVVRSPGVGVNGIHKGLLHESRGPSNKDRHHRSAVSGSKANGSHAKPGARAVAASTLTNGHNHRYDETELQQPSSPQPSSPRF